MQALHSVVTSVALPSSLQNLITVLTMSVAHCGAQVTSAITTATRSSASAKQLTSCDRTSMEVFTAGDE